MKKIIITIVCVAVVLAGLVFFMSGRQDGLTRNFREVAFSIAGEPVRLSNGEAETQTTLGIPSKSTVRYFGNELTHDVDGDGVEDTVFLVTQETAEGNVFFLVVAALKKGDGYVGARATLLGDRIAPQTLEAGEGRVVVFNYADRAPGAPITAMPSVGKSMWLLFDANVLEFGEVVQNFEGDGQRQLSP